MHFPYSPSSTERWLKCPASVPASKGVESEESSYAAEGTKAHEIAEAAIRDDIIPNCDFEIHEAVSVYLDTIRDVRKNTVLAEWIEYTFVHESIKDFGGTPDYVAIYTEGTDMVLHIVDYKHGAGVPVDVIGNKQLLSYAVIVSSFLTNVITKYRLTIVQPRAGGVRTWDTTPTNVADHESDVIEAINSPRFFDSGSHCRWCPLNTTCETLHNDLRKVARKTFEREDTKELLRLHDMATAIRQTLELIEKKLIKMAERGEELPGHRVTERRGHRKWSATEGEIREKLKSEDILTLKSPAQVEKILGSEALEGLVTQTTSGKRVIRCQ